MPEESPVPFRLQKPAITGITALIQSRQNIAAIVSAAETAQPSVSISGLSKKIAGQLRLPRREIEDVLFALLNLRQLRNQIDRSDFFDLLTDAITKDTTDGWKKQHLHDWQEASPIIAAQLSRVSDDHRLALTHKAQTIAYAHQNLLTSTRIITDSRPVFDAAGEDVIALIVGHSLSIQYMTGHHPTSVITFALDADDLAELRKACARAETKAESIKRCFSEYNPVILPE